MKEITYVKKIDLILYRIRVALLLCQSGLLVVVERLVKMGFSLKFKVIDLYFLLISQ